jgi:hypothetical protein
MTTSIQESVAPPQLRQAAASIANAIATSHPEVELMPSGTRHDELLMLPAEYEAVGLAHPSFCAGCRLHTLGGDAT